MDLIWGVILSSVLVHISYSFNFDLNFVDIFKINDDTSYFGYSVLLQKGSTSSVIVGAPKANSLFPGHSMLKKPGALFKCEVGQSNLCKQYLIDEEGNTEHTGGDSRYNYKHKKDGAMLGATIDGGVNVGDPIFVCSPRWINDRRDRSGQHYLANGMCYLITNSTLVNSTADKLMPFLNSGRQGYTLDYVVKYYYAMGELGTSMNYLEKEGELLLGAPGVLSWKGTVLRYKILESNYSPPLQRTQQLRKNIDSAVNIPNPVYISGLKDENIYFGYSISSGHFIANRTNLWYLAGAPRAEDFYGLVMLFEYPGLDDADLMVHKKFVGDQFGSYFGGAVLSLDVTGDGADDLLIGAPTYYIETWDEGCVYFYRNDKKANFEAPIKIFGEKQSGARFGTAIAAIGDINQDNYLDVAISAPYQDGQGVVYIYLGGKNGLNSEYNQKISAKSLNTEIRGFGFSISKGVDVDKNFYNDIAIGAYKSGHVALIKSRPVIKYFTKLSSSMRELAVETTNFNITYCIYYTTATNSIDQVDTAIQLTKDSRAINGKDIIQTITLTKGNNYCDDTEIVLKAGNGDYTKAFIAEFTYKIADLNHTEFCSSCPVTDPAESRIEILSVPFANGCGDDSICQPDLKVSANFENNPTVLVIGVTTTLQLNVHIENKGEPAYLCQLHMKLPPDVEILRLSSRCELSDDRVYNCLIKDVLETNEYKDMVFDFDIKSVSAKDTSLSFTLTVNSKGEEVNISDNIVDTVLPLKLENGVEISGKSHPNQIMYVNEENKIIADTVEYNHEFFIKNFGPSPITQIDFKFHIPIEYNDETTNIIVFDVYEPEVHVKNQPLVCTTNFHSGFYNGNIEGELSDIDESNQGTARSRFRRDVNTDIDNSYDFPLNRTLFINCTQDNIQCMEVSCSSEEILPKNQFINAKFKIRAHIDLLQQLVGNKDIILVSSTVETYMEGKTSKNYVMTQLIGSLKKEGIAYWIIIVSVVAALIILGLIIFILYKFNYFSRPVRDKMQNEIEDSGEQEGLDNYSHQEDEKETHHL